MLRMARTCTAQTGLRQPLPGRRRGAQLRGQRPDPARGAVRAASGSSRPPATPAARSAPRCSSGISYCAAARAARPARTRMQRLAASGPAFADRSRSRRSSTRSAAQVPRCRPTSELLERAAASAGRGEGRRLVPGPDGVRAARARRAQHPRRPAQPEMQSTMNLKIKFRESFRPFAPSVLREHVARVLRAATADEPVHAAGRAGARGAAHRR